MSALRAEASNDAVEIIGTSQPKNPAPTLESRRSGEELGGEKIAKLIQETGAGSVAEIDKLCGQLNAARNYLEQESKRIGDDIRRYTHLAQTASASVKVITNSMDKWGPETRIGLSKT